MPCGRTFAALLNETMSLVMIYPATDDMRPRDISPERTA